MKGNRNARFEIFSTLSRSDAHVRLDLLEALHSEIQILPGVSGGDLRTDTRLALGHHGIAEPDHIYALFQHTGGELSGYLGVVEHDGNNGVAALQHVEAQCAQQIGRASCRERVLRLV